FPRRIPRSEVGFLKITRFTAATTGSAPGRRRALLPLEVRIFPVERAGAADGLHHIGTELLGQLVRGILGRDVGRLGQRDLHQLVGPQRIVERLAQRIGEALVPDVHDRGEVVRLGAQLGAFLRRERHRRAAFMRRKSGYGLIASPSQYLPSAGMRMTWKWRCGVSFGALPVVPTVPRTSPRAMVAPSVRPGWYASRWA